MYFRLFFFFSESKVFNFSRNGLPWWLSGKESTCQCRRHGSQIPYPNAVERLSPCATTIEPVLWSWEAETTACGNY